MNSNISVFSNLFINVVEEHLSLYTYNEQLYLIITTENDPNYKFRNMVLLTKSNIQKIFKTIDTEEFLQMLEVLDSGMININPVKVCYSEVSTNSIKKEEEGENDEKNKDNWVYDKEFMKRYEKMEYRLSEINQKKL